MRGLAVQALRQGIDANDLAPEGHRIQIGLQNLILAPAPVQYLGGYRLPYLLHHAAPARPLAPVAIQQAGQLHGDGAGTPGARVPQIAPGRRCDSRPVHTAVFIKAFVFAQHQRGPQSRRHIGQRHPGAAAHRAVGTLALQHLTFPREQQCLRRSMLAAHLLKTEDRMAGRRKTEQARHHSQRTPGLSRLQGLEIPPHALFHVCCAPFEFSKHCPKDAAAATG